METITLKENLLLEKIDEAELRNIANAFIKIDSVLQGIELPAITEPVNKARDEIVDMVTGAEKGLLKKIFKGFRQKSTLSDVLGIQIQVTSLFRSMPSIMALAGPNIKKSISGASGQQMKSTQAEIAPQTFNKLVQKPLVSIQGTTIRDVLEGPQAQRMEALIEKSLQPGMLEKTLIDPSAVSQQIMDLSVDDFSKLVKKASGLQLRVPISKEDMQALSQAVDDKGTDVNQLVSDLKDPAKGDTLKAALKALNGYDALKPEIANLVKIG